MRNSIPFIAKVLGIFFSLTTFGILIGADKQPIQLSLREAIHRALDYNPDIQRKRLELAKADSNVLKNDSRYTLRVLGEAKIDQNKFPFNQQNLFSGTKTQTNTYSAGVEKLFSTGTYFKVEGKTTRFDSNAFENAANTPAGFNGLGIPPLYTDQLSLTLSQDLLKNSFGLKERNTEKILESQMEIQKDQLKTEVAGLIVNSLVDYWSLIIKENQVDTYNQLLDNIKTIRELTIKKQSLGLSESFEVNQWNGLSSQIQSQVEFVLVEKEEARKKLARSLSLPPDTQFSKLAPLATDLPSTLDFESDLAFAYKHRADYRSISRKKEIADLSISSAKSDALPSLKVSGNYGYQAQNLISPQKNYIAGENGNGTFGMFSFRYPVMSGSLQMNYPIGDPGVKATYRDAEILKRQVALEETDLTQSIRDEVQTRIEILKTSHLALKNAEYTESESEKYYNGILRSFRQGRFNALAVKTALDTLIQDKLALLRAKVDFNINLHRYYVAKNSLFQEYKIDEDKLITTVD